MGLLDDYGIDTSEVEAPSYELEDGIYEFELGDVYVKQGSQNFPDRSWVIMEYLIGDEGKKQSELFELPKEPENMTDRERQKLGYYVARMMDLGVDRDSINSVDRDDLIGLRGTLQLYSSAGKGKNAGRMFQNIKNVKAANASAANQPAEKKAPQTAASNPFA
jgi:hypothetical protein|tara:strand:- start:38 stop:526 length:489 start_codon:yes stop_codon:yes gene_type:complete